MKKVFIAALFALSVGACSFDDMKSVVAENITPEKLRGAMVTACDFAPELSTAAQILSGGYAGVTTATALGEAVCKVIKGNKSLTMKVGKDPVYGVFNGVALRGSFVAK